MWRPDASSPKRQQWESWFSCQRQTARSLLQLQHRVWYRPPSQRFPVRPHAFPDPSRTPAEPQHQPVLCRLLLYVHSLPLRGAGAGPCRLGGRHLLPHPPPYAGLGLQPLPDIHCPPEAGGGASVLPCQRRHPWGAFHRAGPRGSGQRGADQRAPPAEESDHSQRQEGPELQSVQHQRGALRRGCWCRTAYITERHSVAQDKTVEPIMCRSEHSGNSPPLRVCACRCPSSRPLGLE